MCIDIDECLLGPCPPHLICNNVDGNYNCDCPDGTVKNGTDCICKNLVKLRDRFFVMVIHTTYSYVAIIAHNCLYIATYQTCTENHDADTLM